MRRLLLALLSLTTLNCSTTPAPASSANAEGIDQAIQEKREVFRSCYESLASKSDPMPRGMLKADFVIDAKGTVIEAKIAESALKHSDIESCVLRTIRGIRFPATGDRVEVSYPFKFEPRN